MKTITVTTKKKNELYEYAKKLGFEFDEWKFSQKGDTYFQAFKRRSFEVNEQEYHVLHKLNSCLYTAGKHVMSITTTIYNKSGLIGRIEAVIPIACERDIDNVLSEEENLIAFAKKVGIVWKKYNLFAYIWLI